MEGQVVRHGGVADSRVPAAAEMPKKEGGAVGASNSIMEGLKYKCGVWKGISC